MVWPCGGALAELGHPTNPSKTNTLKSDFSRQQIGIDAASKWVLEYK